MNNKEKRQEVFRKGGSIFELNGAPPIRQSLPMALQHVIAMIVGCVTPALVVAGVAIEHGLITTGDSVILVQSALLMAGVATLLQLFPIRKWLGSGLPMIMGASFAYLAVLQDFTAKYSVATIFGAQLIGGAVAIVAGIFIKWLRPLFPPLVSGTVVFTIGISLYKTGISYMAGGTGKPTYGYWNNWVVALVTLAVVTCLNHFAKGFMKLASILIGMVVGYVFALALGMIDFSPVMTAGWFQVTKPLYFGVEFNVSAIITMSILFIVNAVQAVGDLSATTEGGLDREPTADELRGGIIGSGLGSIISAFFGGMPVATYSQNVGIVSTTKVVNRCVLGLAAVIIIIAGLVPKFSSLLTTIPYCVLGGATISVFASITMTGIKLIAKDRLTPRNCAIVGLAVALGVGITMAPGALDMFPGWVDMVFGKSAVVVSTIVTVVLNLVIPKTEAELK